MDSRNAQPAVAALTERDRRLHPRYTVQVPIELRLEGNGKVNRDALGARVTLYREGAPSLVRRVHTDSSYCSASARRVHFGLNGKTAIRKIEVTWPDGSREQWEVPAANRVMNLVRGTGHTH